VADEDRADEDRAGEVQVASPGEFYTWVLGRYRRSINALIAAMIVMTLGFAGIAAWLVLSLGDIEAAADFQLQRLDAAEQRLDAAEHQLHEVGHQADRAQRAVTELPEDFPTPSGELRRRLKCVDANIRILREGVRQLLIGAISTEEYFSRFPLSPCQ
jgi:hypothetical protein